MSYISSLNPPEPGKVMESQDEGFGLGRQLMNLIRTLEKSQKQSLDMNEEVLDRILCLLTNMRESFLRKGLLQGDKIKLNALMAANKKEELNHSSSSTSTGNNKRKRRHQSSFGGQYQLQMSLAVDNNCATADGDEILLNDSSSTSEEILIMTSISRILNPTKSPSKDSNCELNLPWVLIRAAADVLTAVCYGINDLNHPNTHSSQNPYPMIESQIVESFSSNILNSLIKTAKSAMSNIITDGNPTRLIYSEEKQEILSTLSSCFTCFTWIIITLGEKLSRSTNIMMEIKSLVNDLLWADHFYNYFYSNESNGNPLLNSLYSLVSVFPLVGDSNSTPPNKIWTQYVQSITSSYQVLLHNFFPDLSRKQERTLATSTMNLNIPILFNKEVHDWILLIPTRLPSQKQRLTAFTHRANVYSSLLTKLLSLELYDTKAMAYFNAASLPLKQLLDLCDSLVTFSSNAERRYLNTKVRLRDVIVEQGFFSVQSAVSSGNGIKYLGLNLFQTVISMINQSCLIHGKRLLNSCLVSLKSCSSLNVRKIVDPMYSDSALNMGKKTEKDHQRKMKWLHTSIVLRTQAIRAVMYVVTQIGSNIVFESNTFIQLINIVAGCVLEQMLGPERANDDEDWGTLPERVDLVTKGLYAMSSIVSVCGGFMSLATRETIESVALTCMNHLSQHENIPFVFTYASTKSAVLHLSLSCISSPWPDGCASTLIGTLRSVACVLRHDRDDSVSLIAYKAFSVCNAFMTSRAPPLVLGVRHLSHDGDHKRPHGVFESSLATLSYDSLLSGIIGDLKQKKESNVETFDSTMDVLKGDENEDIPLCMDSRTVTKKLDDIKPSIHDKTLDDLGTGLDEKVMSEGVPQIAKGDEISTVACAADKSVPTMTEVSDVRAGYDYRSSLNFNDGKLKSINFEKFSKPSAGVQGSLKEGIPDFEDDLQLPDIIDGDPD